MLRFGLGSRPDILTFALSGCYVILYANVTMSGQAWSGTNSEAIFVFANILPITQFSNCPKANIAITACM